MPNRTVIQWEKDDIEAMKIFKVDLLGLGALTQLHRCFELISQHRGIDLTMSSIPTDDEQVFAMLQKADTTGVFQIGESSADEHAPQIETRTMVRSGGANCHRAARTDFGWNGAPLSSQTCR